MNVYDYTPNEPILDEQPAPPGWTPAYTPIDFSKLSGPEIHGMVVTSEAMAKHVLEEGYDITCNCGPLQIMLGSTDMEEWELCVWNHDANVTLRHTEPYLTTILYHAQTFGLFSSGAWTIHYPPEPDVE